MHGPHTQACKFLADIQVEELKKKHFHQSGFGWLVDDETDPCEWTAWHPSITLLNLLTGPLFMPDRSFRCRLLDG